MAVQCASVSLFNHIYAHKRTHISDAHTDPALPLTGNSNVVPVLNCVPRHE